VSFDSRLYKPDWWNARKAILDDIAVWSRRRGTQYTEAETKRSAAALQCALGEEDGKIEYERNGFTREQWLYKWNPDALDGIHLTPAQMTAMLRDTLRRM
jgi:hypothetical protein